MHYETKRQIVRGMYLLVWPFGLASLLPYKLFGNEVAFDFFSKLLSLIPGKIGQYLRTAFYKMTLTKCHYDLMVGFCSFFSRPAVRVGRRVGLGSFTIVGPCTIGDNVMISSRVAVLDGRQQPGAEPSGSEQPDGVSIGAECWIGEGAIIKASIGSNCVVSAGSVISRPSTDRVIAIGNPARYLKISENVSGAEP